MEFAGIIGLLVLAALVSEVSDYLDKKKKRKQNNTETPSPPISGVEDLPTGDWAAIDECFPANPANSETNGAQDILVQIFTKISEEGTKPVFIGVSCGEHGVDKNPTVKMIQALCLNIPVYEGAPNYHPTQSELSDAIVRHTTNGTLKKIYLGSPAGDLEQALKDGAVMPKLPRLLENTWNARGSNGMPEFKRKAMAHSAKYVLDRLQDKSGAVTEYYTLINKNNIPAPYRDVRAWIDRNRDLEAWNIANSPAILQRNQQLNAGIPNNTGVLRIADVLHMARDGGYERNYARIFNQIQHGMDICKDRIARGAKETLVQTVPPKRKPITQDDFNLQRVSIPQGTAENPLAYPETGKITSINVTRDRYTIKHTKQSVWGLSKNAYQPDRYIQGNFCMIYVRDDGVTEVKAIEHNVSNSRKVPETPRPKGWAYIPHIREGDVYGVFDCTQVRNGDWKAPNQRDERTDIKWLVAK